MMKVLFSYFVCLAGILLLPAQESNAQSLVFSQYYFSPLNINPAMAGTYRDTYFSVSHRSQWRDLNNPYKADVFSLSLPVYIKKPVHQHAGNFAFSAFSESTGVSKLYSSKGFQFAGTYNIRLDYKNTNTLILGLQGGVVQKAIKVDGLQWGSQYNPEIGYDVTLPSPASNLQDRRVFPVFHTGVVWFYNPSRQYLLKSYSGFAGISISNLNQPDISFYTAQPEKAPLMVKIHGGVEYALSSKLRILPGMLTIFNANHQYYLNLGSYLHYTISSYQEKLTLLSGVWYRMNDSFVVSGGFDYKNFTVSSSLDFNQNKTYLPSMWGGAFEISVAYKIRSKTVLKRFYTPMI